MKISCNHARSGHLQMKNENLEVLMSMSVGAKISDKMANFSRNLFDGMFPKASHIIVLINFTIHG